jgi:uncharacterized protein YndB with AHSA1/START domain
MLKKTEVENVSLTLEREFTADAQTLFNAWTRPEQIKQWLGPGDVYINELDLDVRVGGRYRIVMEYPTGEKHVLIGEYKELDAPNKLVCSFQWESKDSPETLLTVLFTPTNKGCKMTLIHERFADDHTRDLHVEGWNGSFDKLEKLLEK